MCIRDRYYFLGTRLSIFTAELTAIMMAFFYLIDLMIKKENIVLFVDSLSALKSLENFNTNTRPDLIFEIFQLIHQLYKKENHITFC